MHDADESANGGTTNGRNGADAEGGASAGDGSGTRVETVHARGHGHVSARHESTFEVTTDDYLTPAGDCILGIEADRAPVAFDEAFVEACRRPEARITVALATDDHECRVRARGHPELTFDSDRSLVVRTSEYVDDRTVAIGADAAAADLDRDLVAALADGATLRVELTVES